MKEKVRKILKNNSNSACFIKKSVIFALNYKGDEVDSITLDI
jgi:hypothetical protein